MQNKKILIVDDDKNICELLRIYIEKEGFDTFIAHDGKTALKIFSNESISLVILDIMLPEIDGWQVCRKIREKSKCPIIMLTAKGEVFDKILGLELGADDYVVKPFESKEIVARIKAILRRTEIEEKGPEILTYDDLTINTEKYELKLNNKKIYLSPKEMELISFLASNPNKVFTRNQILDKIWGFDYYGDTRTVDVHVKRLRSKLNSNSTKWALKTIWGVGYEFETTVN